MVRIATGQIHIKGSLQAPLVLVRSLLGRTPPHHVEFAGLRYQNRLTWWRPNLDLPGPEEAKKTWSH